METNTVIISVERYEELRAHEEFAKDPEKNCLVLYRGGEWYQLRTGDSQLNEITKRVNDLVGIFDKHDKEVYELEQGVKNFKVVLDHVKKMSCREFRQWKKQNA
jgi:hypothetical protein